MTPPELNFTRTEYMMLYVCAWPSSLVTSNDLNKIYSTSHYAAGRPEATRLFYAQLQLLIVSSPCVTAHDDDDARDQPVESSQLGGLRCPRFHPHSPLSGPSGGLVCTHRSLDHRFSVEVC